MPSVDGSLWSIVAFVLTITTNEYAKHRVSAFFLGLLRIFYKFICLNKLMPLYVYTIFPHFGWWADDIQKAFGKHLATYGGLDICINSAGIGSKIVFHNDETDGAQTWRRVIDVNLIGVMACTQLAVCLHMGLGFHRITMKCCWGQIWFYHLACLEIGNSTHWMPGSLINSLYPSTAYHLHNHIIFSIF